MFHEQRMDVDGLTPADLRAEYEADLADAVEAVGIDAAVEETTLDRDALTALVEDESPSLSLEEAAQVQSLADGVADAETVVEMACEHLLLGMTTGVMDVDAVSRDLAIDLDPKEVQQKIERRAPMSFDEFVHVQHAIANGQP
ncbi:hypothetical protein G9464_07560 [Halostella sp. JP-L12]|uniref:DUF5791 family protein n=1 Tax=Halostella TaxID=1843185 RepID=UPI000EF838E9|nr:MULTISPECIES: DUF5791 family protein [Halostella]NHN47451.1 hypothetical protein [Halostella sp. JP-L12]